MWQWLRGNSLSLGRCLSRPLSACSRLNPNLRRGSCHCKNGSSLGSSSKNLSHWCTSAAGYNYHSWRASFLSRSERGSSGRARYFRAYRNPSVGGGFGSGRASLKNGYASSIGYRSRSNQCRRGHSSV